MSDTVYREPGNETGAPEGVARRDVPVEVVRLAFHESGLSIAELARRLGLHPSGVGRVVRGHAATFYCDGKDGRTRYVHRTLSLSRRRAQAYLLAMGYGREETNARLAPASPDNPETGDTRDA